MIIKTTKFNYPGKGKILRCLFLFLLIILNMNKFLLSDQKQNEKQKIDIVPGPSYQSKTPKKESKTPQSSKISLNGDSYLMKEGDYRLIHFKISEDEKKSDEILWSKNFESKIEEFDFDQTNGDRIYVDTSKGTLIGGTQKGNFSYDTIKGKKVKNIPRTSPEGSSYARIKGKKNIIFGNRDTGDVSSPIKAHNKKIIFYDFISKHLLLTIGKDNIIKVWNRNTGEMVMNTMIHPSRILAAKLTFDRKYLVIGTYDFKINLGIRLDARSTDVKEKFKLKIIDTSSLSIIKEIEGATAHIEDLSISADNKFAAVLKEDKTVDIWDLENAYKIQSFTGEPYSDAEFGRLGATFLLTTETGKIKRYITRGIVVESRPQYVGEKYKINTPTTPIITKLLSGNTIAILDFSGLLIDSEVAQAISYSFRNRMSNYSYIRLVERDEMNNILNEQGIQNSGVTSPGRAAQIGKILNAKKLIMGKLTKLGSTLITSIKVVDVESAQIEGGREVECQNYALENVPEIIDILLNILIEK